MSPSAVATSSDRPHSIKISHTIFSLNLDWTELQFRASVLPYVFCGLLLTHVGLILIFQVRPWRLALSIGLKSIGFT
jgi:hypothetical protein